MCQIHVCDCIVGQFIKDRRRLPIGPPPAAWLAMDQKAVNTGLERLVPPKTSTNAGCPGMLSGVTMISAPVSGSAGVQPGSCIS